MKVTRALSSPTAMPAGKTKKKQTKPDFPDSIVRTLKGKDLRAKRIFRRTMTWTQCSSTAP
jgi:hypothetical protein